MNAVDNAVMQVRFSETIRLPQPWFGVLVTYGAIGTAGLAVLWSVASLTTTQRVVFGVLVAGQPGRRTGMPCRSTQISLAPVMLRGEILARRPPCRVKEGVRMSVTDELLQNAQAYADSFDKGNLPMPPGKQVAVLACMDARSSSSTTPTAACSLFRTMS